MVVLKPSSDDTLSFDNALVRVISAYKSIIVGDVLYEHLEQTSKKDYS